MSETLTETQMIKKILDLLDNLDTRISKIEQILVYPAKTITVDPKGLEYEDIYKKLVESKKEQQRCAFEGIPPGTPMGLVCSCPKCVPYSLKCQGVVTHGDASKFSSGQISFPIKGDGK